MIPGAPLAGLKLSITGFNPANGAPGITVTITGTGFSSVRTENNVKFSGITADSILKASTTELEAVVPQGAESGSITVSVKGREVSSSSGFTVEAPDYNEEFYSGYASRELPEPPAGKKWVLDENTSDEFENDTFDTSKWMNQLDTWDGRPPGYFVADNISVSDGYLKITSNWLEEEIETQFGTYTIGTGAVGSQNDVLFPVYTEAHLRANNMPLSSTFWLSSGSTRGMLEGCLTYSTELDVIETIGGPYEWDDSIENFNTKLHSNTHFRTRDCGSPETFYSNGPDESVQLGYKTHEEFHTYGVYWVDATQASIYIDGTQVYNIQFDSSQKSNPFDLPMKLRMVTETYDFVKPPSEEMLDDESRNNVSQYDWVRTYKLVDK